MDPTRCHRPGLVRFAGLLATTGAFAAAAPPVGPACPPGATDEGEPCDDSGGPDLVNGGCSTLPVIFADASCGETLCGLAWALDGTRDTDQFQMLTPEASQVSLTVTPEFPAIVVGTTVGPGGVDCSATYVLWTTEVGPGETGTLSLPTPTAAGDIVWWFIGTSIFDGVPCGPGGEFGNGYVATFSCAAAPCPGAGDLDGDGMIDFEDLLVVLANFGPCS